MEEKERRNDKENSLEIIEEKLIVDKQKVETGKVRISKRVHEEEIPLDLETSKEEIEIDVKKIGRVVETPGDAVRTEGDSTVYSVYKEVYVKQTILEEEVWVTRKKTTQVLDEPQTLRREEIVVERSSDKNNTNNQNNNY